MTPYVTVRGESASEIVIEKSRFISTIKNVTSETEAKEFLAVIKKKHAFATHNCYAYVIDENNMKMSDDGEPSGTAGMPILEAIKNNNLKNVIVIVTRYFGGIKLGAGGLVRAYTKSTAFAIEETEKVKMSFCSELYLRANYENYPVLSNYLIKHVVKVILTEYLEDVLVKILVLEEEKDSFIKNLVNFMSAKIQIQIKNEYYYNI